LDVKKYADTPHLVDIVAYAVKKYSTPLNEQGRLSVQFYRCGLTGTVETRNMNETPVGGVA